MKNRIKYISILLFLFCSSTFTQAQKVKSFMQMEILSPSNFGPITGCDQDAGLWIEWSSNDNYMEMLDGTIWKYDYTDDKNERHYKFKKSSMSIVPGTTYHEAVVSFDKTKVVIIYTFGLSGFYTKMYATYGYIGEGKQPAIDYITQRGGENNYTYSSDKYRTFVKTRNKCSKCSCSGYWGYKHGNGTYEGNCSNSDGWGHTCGHGPEKHGLRKW